MSKEKKKGKGKKVLLIILAVILVIAIVAVIFIKVTTLPKDASDPDRIAVGGMVTSDTVDYQADEDSKLAKNPEIRIMQMIWRFCASGDANKHKDQTPPSGITEDDDIAYIDDGNIYHQLDVYYPENYTENMPVIIDIHGGGWMYGDKELNKYYCLELASRGYVVFNMSYRLVPDTTVDGQLQDVSYALKWISENMDKYPCDSKNIMLTGDSAGGMLAVYSAALLQSSELREAFGTQEVNMNVSALLLTSPVSYMENGGWLSIYTRILWGSDYKDKATYQYMDLSDVAEMVDLPPTYLITSEKDTMANSQTHTAYVELKQQGVPCEIVDYQSSDFSKGEKIPHVFSVLYPFSEAGTAAIDGAMDFYQQVINGTFVPENN